MKKPAPDVSIAAIFKQMWPGIQPYRWSFFGSLICFVIGLTVNVFVPIYYKQFFDVLSGAIDKNLVGPSLIQIITIIAILHGLNWLFYRVAYWVFNSAESRIMARLKQNAFDYLMLHSYTFFANNFAGSLVQRINRFSRSFERLADTLVFNLIPMLITIIGSVAVTYFMAPLVSAIIVVWVLLFTAFNLIFSRWKMKYDLAVAEADSATTGLLADDISNHNAITLFAGYQRESASFQQATDEQARKTIFSWNLGGIVDMVQVLLIYVVEFAVFYYAIIFWQQGQITVGTFVLIQVYIIGLAEQLWGLNRIIRGIYESIADAKEMVEIMLLPHDIKDKPGAKILKAKQGAIDFDQVSFSFNQTRQILDQLNLHIAAGEKIALVGPSGAGKTTLVRLILRLYEPAAGTIKIDGQDISSVTQDSLRAKISLVPQDPVLFHRSLLENIRYGRPGASDKEVLKAAKLAHCDDFIDQLPLKYQTFVGERGVKLSGGERQRVAIARAILKNAPVLILDEATSSLDSHSEALIQDALEHLMKNRTTIVIAHRLSTIRKMDRIIVVDRGGIAESGTHQELSEKTDGLYKKLWDLQVKGFIK